LKSRLRDPVTTPFDLTLHFVLFLSYWSSCLCLCRCVAVLCEINLLVTVMTHGSDDVDDVGRVMTMTGVV